MHSLKILEQDDETAIVGGYGVVFGGEDLEGETFAADTDFMLDLVPVKPVYIDHSGDSFVTADGKTIKLVGVSDPVGRVLEVTADDVGLYMKLQLEKAGRYWRVVEEMIGTGKAGLSSGTIGHLARREGKTITRWPIVEESITLTPAEPRTVGVERLKALAELNPDLKALVPEADGTPAVDEAMDMGDEVGDDMAQTAEDAAKELSTDGAGLAPSHIEFTEDVEMSGQNAQAQADPRDEEIKALSDRVNQLIDLMEKAPALKSAGYTTDDGGTADPTHKSFGDFLLAVKRGDTKRIAAVYGAQKDMAEAAGATGGYLVPSEFHNELLKVMAEQSPIYARVRKQPVMTDAGEYPALDQFVAPTTGAGNTALAGGVSSAITAEGATLTETQPTFANLEYRIHKIGGFVEVSNELISDSPQSIEALLRSLFGIAIGAKNERNILRGTGVAEPLGILNAACTIGVTTATNDVFAYADALAMTSRFKAVSGQTPVWIAHPSLIPDIGVLSVASGSPVVWAGNLAAGQPNTLLGYPLIFSEHMPQANGDDMILADLGAYVLFERQALSIAFSEHAAFTADKGTWRFTARNDGQPWMKSAITLADPTGSYTVSPFVYHND
jgi:HK97 family phage major capsid protein